MATDKRAHVRYTPSCNAFISLGADFIRVGSIRDISLTGASFEHFPYNQLVPPGDHCIDIFTCRSEVHIKNIPCRIVYEIPVPESHPAFLTNKAMIQKRYGIEFRAVTIQQGKQLETLVRHYIQTHTQKQA